MSRSAMHLLVALSPVVATAWFSGLRTVDWGAAQTSVKPAPPAARVDQPGATEFVLRDEWVTVSDGIRGNTYQDLTIPAGFFGPDCEGFTGRVELAGQPLEQGSKVDTVVERTGDPIVLGDPVGTSRTVALRLAELSLVSKEPITVACGGESQQWRVLVKLSPTSPPAGWMTATKLSPAGGTFESTLYVQPLLVFTNVADPSQVRVLDTAGQIEPVELHASDAPFSLASSSGGQFMPGRNPAPESAPLGGLPPDSEGEGVGIPEEDNGGVYVPPSGPPPNKRATSHIGPGHEHCVEPPKVEDTFCSTADITVEVFEDVLYPGQPYINENLFLSSANFTDTVITRTAPPYEDCFDVDCVPSCPEIETEMTDLELGGFSTSLGSVIVRERTDQQSLGGICCVDADASGEFISGNSYFNVWVAIEVPDYGVVVDTNEPVRLQAENITELPPFGQGYIPQPPAGGVCDQPGGPQRIALYLQDSPYQVGWLTHAMHMPGCCTVTIQECRDLCVGEQFTFSAIGSPPGGTYSWSVAQPGNQLTPTSGSGQTFPVTAQEPSQAQNDVTVKVIYAAPDGTFCSDECKLTVIQIDLTDTPPAYLPQNSNTVQYTATITPNNVTDKIRFELSAVSDFPGDAMNHGAQADNDPDYKFDPAANPDFDISADQLTATTKQAVNSATVTVTAYDFGAIGKIQAIMVVKGCQSAKRTIPKDTDGDTLPDAYENAQPDKDPANADTDGDATEDGVEDDDTLRAVVANAGPNNRGDARTDQGLLGDGLVAFEEYRGFFIDSAHTRTTTQTKDVFAQAAADIPGGIGYFANLTDFHVRSILNTEWDGEANRFINGQRAGIPGATDQRALRIIKNDALPDLAQTFEIPGNAINQSPNEILRIEINVGVHHAGLNGKTAGPDGALCTDDDATYNLTEAEAQNALRETVGHECGHGCHVEHTWCTGDLYVFPREQGLPNSVNIRTGLDGVCNTPAVGNDVPLIPVGKGRPGTTIITAGANGVLDVGLGGDDVRNGHNITTGPNGVAETAGHGDDVQVIAVGQALPNAVIIIDGGDGLQTTPAGDDTIAANTITGGPNGIAETTAAGNDVQVIPVGQGQPNATSVQPGPNGILDPLLAGDDMLAGNEIQSGPDGIADTSAVGDDVQVIPVGRGQPNADCVNTGPDGVSDTTRVGDDEPRIPVGNGEPNTVGIMPGGDGVLNATLGGDDVKVGENVVTGPNGILNSFARVDNEGVISILTSDVLVPVPNTYSGDDLDQVRFHMKHP